MKHKWDTKFGEEWTHRFRTYIRIMTNFDLRTWKSQKCSVYWANFEQSIYSLSQKSIEELSFMKLKRDRKVVDNWLVIWNWPEEFDKIWPEHSEVSKMFILMGSFWAKYILLELKKYRGGIFHETEEGCKICRWIDRWFQIHLTWALESLKNFHMNGLHLSKVYIVWAKKV